MKYKFLLISCFFVFITSISAQKKKHKPEEKIEQYCFIMIKTGTKQDFDSTQRAALFENNSGINF